MPEVSLGAPRRPQLVGSVALFPGPAQQAPGTVSTVAQGNGSASADGSPRDSGRDPTPTSPTGCPRT
eukprot:10017984-Lingulodinium_polyedra.AAC.1